MESRSQQHCPLCSSGISSKQIHAFRRGYLTCPRCALVFMLPEYRLAASAEEARYLLHQNNRADSGYCQHLRRAIAPLTSLVTSGYGLDFGCGPSHTASELLEEMGYTVTNYDPFFAPDQSALEYEYDFILCTEVAEHFHLPFHEFDRLHRMLKPGGWLALMTKLLERGQALTTWWYAKDPTHVSLYSQVSLDWISKRWSWTMQCSSEDVYLLRKALSCSRTRGTIQMCGSSMT